jgi:uncharacterized protein (TIGR02996 family)
MREAFEQAILNAPNEVSHYAAYADWLSEQGDPRGEFMAVQLSLEDSAHSSRELERLRTREKELLDAHQEQWLGPLAPFLLHENTLVGHPEDSDDQQRPNYEWRFERGFLSSLTVRYLSVPTARAIRDDPATAFLRELVIESILGEGNDYEPGPDVPTFEQDNIQFVSIYPLLGTPQFTCLRYFQVGAEVDMNTFVTSHYGPSSHAYCNPAHRLVARMPALEELHLLCKDFYPDPIFASFTLANLRVLRIYHLGWDGADRRPRARYEYPLDTLAANPWLARLTHLLFHPHHEERWRDGAGHFPSFLPLEQVRALFDSPHLTALTHLQLRLSSMGDAGCRALVDSGLLRRLRWLDLRHGCISDEGARILAGCLDLRRLEHLDLSRNGLTDEGIAALRATGVPMRADRQQTAEELAEEAYLCEGDFE